MRKILVFIPITFCFLFSANAQLKWGANAGVSISNVNHIEAVHPKSLVTLQFSGFAAIPVSNSFVVQPSLGYRGKGYKLKYRGDSRQIKVPFNYLQLSTPVILRCNANDNFKLYAGGGPYLAYLINVKWNDSTVRIENFHRFDVGLNLSFLFIIHNRWTIGVASDLGFINPNKFITSTNISSGITIGYFFN